MPDDEDYEALGRTLQHPEEWSLERRAQMERLLLQQRQMVEDAHLKDRMGRDRLSGVVAETKAAIAAYNDSNRP